MDQTLYHIIWCHRGGTSPVINMKFHGSRMESSRKFLIPSVEPHPPLTRKASVLLKLATAHIVTIIEMISIRRRSDADAAD